MKLKEFIVESALIEVRSYVANNLFEDVNQYLSLTLAKLKNKKPEEAFKDGDRNAVDLDHLTSIVVGLKVLANSDHRAALTKSDIGIQANDSKEIFRLFSEISKDGNDNPQVEKVFASIAKLAPTAIKKQRSEFEQLKSGDDAERNHIIQQLEQFLHKVSQAYGKLRQSSNKPSSNNINNMKTVGMGGME